MDFGPIFILILSTMDFGLMFILILYTFDFGLICLLYFPRLLTCVQNLLQYNTIYFVLYTDTSRYMNKTLTNKDNN